MADNLQLNNSVDSRDYGVFIKKDLGESTDMKQDIERNRNKVEESEKDQSSEEPVNSSKHLSIGNMQEIPQLNDSVDSRDYGVFIKKDFEESTDMKQDIEGNHNKVEESEKDQSSEEPVGCDECGKSFPDKNSLSSHKSYIHKIEVSVCQVCGNEFQNKWKLQQHVNNVHNDQSIQCEMCSKLFKNRSLLYGHKKIVHEVIENLACPSCGIKVMNTYKLQKHLKRICIGYKGTKATPTNHTCIECNKTFKTNSILNKHYKHGHSNVTLKCQICYRNFKNIPSFRNHLNRAHETIGPSHISALINEVSPVLEKKNESKNLTAYQKQRRDRRQERKKQKESKTDVSYLTAYQKQRRDLVQKWKEIENEQNALKKTLKSIEKHQCDECGKSFSDKEKLNNHTRIKHTSDPCTCPFCGGTLDNKSNLRQHIKKFHKDVSTAKKRAKKMKKEIKMNSDLLEEFPIGTVKTEKDSINVKKEVNHSTDMKQHLDGMHNKTEESDKEQSSEDVEIKSEAHEAEDEPHTCPFCEGTILKNKSYLMMHINRFHEGDKLPDYTKMKDEVIDAENKLETREDNISFNEKYVIAEKIKTFICDSCGKAFEKAHLLKRHEMVHSDQKPFGCSNCPKTFTSKAGIDCHKLSHTNERPFMCDLCSKTFTTKFRFKQHKLSHTGEKPYACDECGKSFSTKDIMMMHKKKGNCYENKPLICNLCSKTFKYGANLKSHEQKCNGGKSVNFFICSECGKTCKSKIAFQDHKCAELPRKKKPKIEEPKICSVCEKEFKNSVFLRKHQKTTIKCSQTGTEIDVQCKVCGKTCKSKHALYRHTSYVHRTEEQHTFCSLCGKEFKNYDNLKQHQRKTIGCSQTGKASPVECPACGKEFANKHVLYSHNYSAHTIENVNCPNCGKTCKNKLALRLHVKRSCASAVNMAKDTASAFGAASYFMY